LGSDEAVCSATVPIPFLSIPDRCSFFEKALNAIGLTRLDVGRSFALIAGVTRYPNFPPLEQGLKPAEVDIKNWSNT
jgi:hypothetical protein